MDYKLSWNAQTDKVKGKIIEANSNRSNKNSLIIMINGKT